MPIKLRYNIITFVLIENLSNENNDSIGFSKKLDK